MPVVTVKTRIARGLDALRKRFDREHGGDRGAWIAAFLPLAADPAAPIDPAVQAPDPLASAPLAPTLMTLAMDAKLKIAAVLALVVCGTGVWIATRDGHVEPALAALAESEDPALQAPDERADPDDVRAPDSEPRVAVVGEERTAAVVAPPVRSLREGVVLDLDRRPVAGVAILESWPGDPVVEDGAPVVSDARGRFRVESDRVFVAARGNGWITVFAGIAQLARPDDEIRVVVARERSWTGRVVDANGAPVAGAIVDQHVGDALRHSFGELLRRPVDVAHSTRTDAEGRFDLAPAPDVDSTLAARADNHRPGSKVVVAGTTEDVVIVLPAPDPESVVLHGRVYEADGAAAPDTTLIVVGATAKTGADGRFELAVPRRSLDEAQRTTEDGRPPLGPVPVVLRAAKHGHLPAQIVLPVLEDLERNAATTELRLVLGGAPLALSGRVVDSRGEPIAGARVTLLGEQPFGRFEVHQDGITWYDERTIEQFLRDPGAAPTTSGADGRFAIEGLQARAYRIDVVADRIPAARVTAPIDAGGPEVEIVLATDGPRVDLAGRVVDRRGAGVASAHVVVSVALDGYEDLVGGPSTTSDAEGRFALGHVLGRPMRIEVLGSHVVSARIDLRPDAQLGDLVLDVSRRAFVQVDLGDRRDLADSARLVDASGRDLEIDLSRTIVGAESSTSISWRSGKLAIADGRSSVAGAPEGEYTCVLEKAGQEVVRIPVSLGGAEVTVVRP